jgi:hypothetical protein
VCRSEAPGQLPFDRFLLHLAGTPGCVKELPRPLKQADVVYRRVAVTEEAKVARSLLAGFDRARRVRLVARIPWHDRVQAAMRQVHQP